jgi:hypothetical protein
MRSLSSIKKQVGDLARLLGPPKIIAAVVWQGVVRQLLFGAVNSPAPAGMSEDDLPPGCRTFESDPSEECAWLYRGTDGRPHCQRALGVDGEVVLGRKRRDLETLRHDPRRRGR